MLQKGMLKEYSHELSMLVRCLDLLMIFIAGWLAFSLRFGEVFLSFSYFVALCASLVVASAIFSFLNMYVSIRGQSFLKHVTILSQAISILGLILSGLAFLTKSGNSFSRSWFVLWMILSLVILIIFRFTLIQCLRFMRARGLNERRIVIVGAGELGRRFIETLQQALWTGFRVVAILDDDADHKPQTLCGVPVMQTPYHLSQYLAQEAIDEIWLAIPLHAEARVKQILHTLRHQTITTRFVLNIFSFDLLNHSLEEIAGFPVINIRSTPMTGFSRAIKALEDRFIASVILLIISPLLIILAIGVKISSRGPIFFKQKRLGWDGRVINVYKFRTMIEHQEVAGMITQAKWDDKRVTAFGRWLRKTSLDELPQFINVLQGRMSIVGPRPHALQHNELYKESIHTYMQRHSVKPGITGWAQVNGWRGETDTLEKMQKRVEYDLFYINNWSLGFDIKIIFLTLFRGFLNPNAY
jgi:putative colanic acid biosysnthesis UDP-glucose lipid carrier transferase